MPGYSFQPFPAAPYHGQPLPAPRNQPRLASPTRQPAAAHAASTRIQQPPARVRLQNELATTPRTALRMPSPEELGLHTATKRRDDVDWVDVRQRVQALRLTSFHLQKLAEGGFRFVCLVPTQAGERRVEAEALTEAGAIDQALTQAEALR